MKSLLLFAHGCSPHTALEHAPLDLVRPAADRSTAALSCAPPPLSRLPLCTQTGTSCGQGATRACCRRAGGKGTLRRWPTSSTLTARRSCAPQRPRTQLRRWRLTGQRRGGRGSRVGALTGCRSRRRKSGRRGRRVRTRQRRGWRRRVPRSRRANRQHSNRRAERRSKTPRCHLQPASPLSAAVRSAGSGRVVVLMPPWRWRRGGCSSLGAAEGYGQERLLYFSACG